MLVKSSNLFLVVTFSITRVLLDHVEGYNILMTAYPNSKSHKGSMYPLGKALAARGHKVGIFCELKDESVYEEGVPVGLTNEQVLLRNRQFNVWYGFGYRNDTGFLDIQWNRIFNPLLMIPPWFIGTFITREHLTNEQDIFQKVIYYDDHNESRWDLIIVDSILTNTGVAIAAKLRVPYVLMTTTLWEQHVLAWKGYPTPSHTYAPYYPTQPSWSSSRFWDRLGNSIEVLQFKPLNELVIPALLYWSTKAIVPELNTFQFYADSDGYFSDYPGGIDWPRPLGPEFLVTSLTCQNDGISSSPTSTSMKIPKDLEDFIVGGAKSGSKGAILMAFGTQIDWGTAPARIRDEFIAAFAELSDYRILWQYDEKDIPPALRRLTHVRSQKWLPQAALLNDPRTRLFISHGGLKSFKETLCAGVPVLYLPLFADQPRNALLAARNGYGEVLSKLDIHRSDLLLRIRRMLSRYDTLRVKALKTRSLWLDRIIPAVTEGAWRSEFIIRHGGLPRQMKNSAGQSLYWFQYYYIDLLTLTLSAGYLALRIFWESIKMMFAALALMAES